MKGKKLKTYIKMLECEMVNMILKPGDKMTAKRYTL